MVVSRDVSLVPFHGSRVSAIFPEQFTPLNGPVILSPATVKLPLRSGQLGRDERVARHEPLDRPRAVDAPVPSC